jgi:hypothetical protein
MILFSRGSGMAGEMDARQVRVRRPFYQTYLRYLMNSLRSTIGVCLFKCQWVHAIHAIRWPPPLVLDHNQL